MSNDNTKAALLLAENFIDEHGNHLPDVNLEITSDGRFEAHIHLSTPTQLAAVHAALGQPKWSVSDATDTSASVPYGNKGFITIYYSQIRDEPAAQAPLRKIGLVRGLVAL